MRIVKAIHRLLVPKKSKRGKWMGSQPEIAVNVHRYVYVTFNSLYAAWNWGYPPLGPPRASCQVSIRTNICSFTPKSGCARNVLISTYKYWNKTKKTLHKKEKITFFFTILTMSCKISRSTICWKILSPQFFPRVSNTWKKNMSRIEHMAKLTCHISIFTIEIPPRALGTGKKKDHY